MDKSLDENISTEQFAQSEDREDEVTGRKLCEKFQTKPPRRSLFLLTRPHCTKGRVGLERWTRPAPHSEGCKSPWQWGHIQTKCCHKLNITPRLNIPFTRITQCRSTRDQLICLTTYLFSPLFATLTALSISVSAFLVDRARFRPAVVFVTRPEDDVGNTRTAQAAANGRGLIHPPSSGLTTY